jgi:hypothetical protein
MHPIIVEYAAEDLRRRRLDEAAAHRRRRAAVHAVPAQGWRGRLARRLVGLARRVDPGVEVGSHRTAPLAS